VLDSGDAFGKKGKRDEIYTEVLLKMYGMMHYNCLNLGKREFTYGLDYLQKKAKNSPFAFLSANVMDKKSQKPVFKPYIIKTFGEQSTLGFKHGGVRVGIFGVASADAIRSMSLDDKEKLQVKDPVTEAERVVSELKAKCDMIIGMGNMRMQDARKLVTQVKGIHLFIVSGNMRRLYKPETVKDSGTILLKAAYRGKKVGEFLLTFDMKQKKISQQTGKLVSIDSKIPKDPEIDKMAKEAKRRAGRQRKKPTPKMSSVGDKAKPGSALAFRPKFVGTSSCAKCHPKISQFWMKTKHAHALATLTRIGKDKDSTCFRCHTTGYSVSGGYLNQKETPQLADVRCEACHGPASMHLDNSKIKLRKPNIQICRECHTGAHGKPFDWYRDKKLVHQPAAPAGSAM